MEKETRAITNSGNIFKDMGRNNPDEILAKARIASMIYDIIESRGNLTFLFWLWGRTRYLT